MTINLKAKTEKTLCGGRLNALIDVTNKAVTVKFDGVKETNLCGKCPFLNFCPVTAYSSLDTIQVLAFTGMPIGILPITRESQLFIEVTTSSNKVMRFDRKTGVQTNCSNSRFANRVNPRDIPKFTGKQAR